MVAGKSSSPKHRAEIVKCLNVLLVICRMFGFKGKAPLKGSIDHWTELAGEEGVGWMKLTKYKLSAYFAFHHHCPPLPVPPFTGKDHPGALFSGRLGRWSQLMLQRASPEWKREFLASIKQSKKGMPRDTSRATLRKQEEAAVLKLTTKPEEQQKGYNTLANWSEWDRYPAGVELVLNRQTWEHQIRRTVRELFHGKPLTTAERTQAFFPSTSANYIMNRKNAGAIGAILEHPTLMTGLRVHGGYSHETETKSRERDESEQMENEQWSRKGLEFTPGYDAAFRTLWIRVLSAAAQEEPNAEPVALPEPLKYRVITKGPPFIQTMLRAVWKSLHTEMRHHPAFELIGKPVDEIYISDRLGNQLAAEQRYLSGDYADATNGLFSWASNCAADEVSNQKELYPVERRLLESSLTGHILRGQPQQRGQLMGSITSFVILCIINAAACRWAVEVDQRRTFTLRDAPIMINGDDCAIKCTETGRQAWKLITAFVGLEESVGKTYFTKDFVEINSTQFVRSEEDPLTVTYEKTEWKPPPVRYSGAQKVRVTRTITRAIPFRLTRYLNVGLLFGLKRSGLSVGLNDQDDPRNNLGTRYRELMRLAPLHLKGEAHNAFINHHRKLLDTTRLPWFVPEWIGGVGLVGHVEPGEKDLRIARMIVLNWAKRRPISLAHQESNWKTWQVASKRVPKPFVVGEKNAGTDVYTRAVASECINLLFDSSVPLSQLFQIVTERRTSGAIRHNAKLWSPATYKKLPAPMELHDLIFRPQYLSYEEQGVPPSSSNSLSIQLD